jgi:predicted unusual protein kinase regulating ubiquinone biosynthesis (AarF/ABC1/UbiB family)
VFDLLTPQVTDTAAMERASLDRHAIMESVCRSFAYQVHVLGRFNGDPHPGQGNTTVNW